jgi:hypothetical protein
MQLRRAAFLSRWQRLAEFGEQLHDHIHPLQPSRDKRIWFLALRVVACSAEHLNGFGPMAIADGPDVHDSDLGVF